MTIKKYRVKHTVEFTAILDVPENQTLEDALKIWKRNLPIYEGGAWGDYVHDSYKIISSQLVEETQREPQ
jgi:hypothetical protein